MNRKTKKPRTFYELQKSIRGSWNGVNPVTKVVDNKNHYSRKEKYKINYINDTYDCEEDDDFEDLSDEEYF